MQYFKIFDIQNFAVADITLQGHQKPEVVQQRTYVFPSNIQ